jgi:hypothetical protein
MKIRHWESSYCVPTDKQTGMTKLKVAFPNFANAPNIQMPSSAYCIKYLHPI